MEVLGEGLISDGEPITCRESLLHRVFKAPHNVDAFSLCSFCDFRFFDLFPFLLILDSGANEKVS